MLHGSCTLPRWFTSSVARYPRPVVGRLPQSCPALPCSKEFPHRYIKRCIGPHRYPFHTQLPDLLLDPVAGLCHFCQVGRADCRGVCQQASQLFKPLKTRKMLKRKINFRWIKDLQQDFGLTTLYATSNLEDAKVLGDRIAFLDRGRLIGVEKPEVAEALVASAADPEV